MRKFAIFLAVIILFAISAGVIFGGFKSSVSRVLTLNNTVKLKDAKTSFGFAETPRFSLSVPQKSTAKVGKVVEEIWETDEEKIKAVVVYKADDAKIPASIKKTAGGEFEISIEQKEGEEIRRGDYKLQIDARESFIYERNLTQDFSWGVLAINTHKSVYLPGETANLAMGVLDEDGDTVCNANITLIIADPDKNEKTLKTGSGIKNNPLCGNTPDPTPDYAATYKVGKPGRYYMHIIAENKNGKRSLTDYFEVREQVPFDIERINFPTRIYPAAAYPVKIKIKVNEDYKGKFTDYALSSMKITKISNGGTAPNPLKGLKMMDVPQNVKESDEEVYGEIKDVSDLLYARPEGSVDKTPMPITWNVDWKKGTVYELTYTVNFPGVSPEFYLMGPIKVGDFEEVRQWQVASDAIRCWDGGGADESWQTVGNWSGNARPGSADRAVFDNTFAAVVCAGATDASPNKDSDLDTAFTGNTIQRIDILNYTGTITQTQTINLSVGGTNIGFVQSAAGSTWTGSGAVDITLTATTGDFRLTAGTFTAPGGTITVMDEYVNSGGTFNANSGTVVLFTNDAATNTYTGDTTFYNLTFSSNACCNSGNIVIPSGTELIVTGTLLFQEDIGYGWVYFSGPGTIEARGNITVISSVGGFMADPAEFGKILINGTGDQTFTGIASNTGRFDGMIPSVTINKSSGTLRIVDVVKVSGDWTYVRGNVNATGSTVIYQAIDNTSRTITGTVPLDTVYFTFDNCCNASEIAVASGSRVIANDFYMNSTVATHNKHTSGEVEVRGDLEISDEDGIWNWGALGTLAITLTGSQNQTITQSGTTIPDNTFTIAKSGGEAILATNLTINNSGQDFNLTSGVLDMSTFNLTVDDTLTINGQLNQGTGNVLTGASGEIAVGSTGIYTNNSTGDITIGAAGSGFSNAGYVRLDGGGPSCGDTDSIAIATTTATTARDWSGAGTYIMIDLTVRDANDSGIVITAYNSTLTSNSDWVFDSGCPTYSNRSITNITGGINIIGGTSITSN